MDYIKLGLSGLPISNLVSKSTTIVQRMTGNANFETPTPALADITQVIDELVTAIGEVSSGSHQAMMVRDLKAAELKAMMSNLAAYITMIAAGNGRIIESSGFELRKKSEAHTSLETPAKFEAERGSKSGSAKLTWKPVAGAKSYVIEVTTTDPAKSETVWEVAMITTRTRNTLDNLTLREYYWYRVKAIGSKVESDYSNVNLILAA